MKTLTTYLNESTKKILFSKLPLRLRKIENMKYVVDDINNGFDSWFFNPQRFVGDRFDTELVDTDAYAIRKLIVHLSMGLHTNDANKIFTYIQQIFNTPKQWIERYFRTIRQIEDIEVSLNFGLNYIEFLK